MLGQKKPTNNFKFKNCLFSAKKSKKEKYAYSSCGIRFDSAGLLSFIITLLEMLWLWLGVDSTLSSDVDNRKNKFLVVGEGLTFGINEICGSAEKKFSINFSETSKEFCLSLHYNVYYISLFDYLFVNGKEI